MKVNWLFVGFLSVCVLGFANPHYAEMTEERPVEYFPQGLQQVADNNPTSTETTERKTNAHDVLRQEGVLTQAFVRTCQRHILLQRFLN
ncbi:MAG TPA: hypothetical protein DCE41_06080 [Cytophagales bacterium]|nr:hypothetical protein [Cytophagales bacterium]HAA22741.1 hypothetical protein [Cytophagales bacterium]HAP63293.1 hypothetical protein [Cytophagales bacterium]